MNDDWFIGEKVYYEGGRPCSITSIENTGNRGGNNIMNPFPVKVQMADNGHIISTWSSHLTKLNKIENAGNTSRQFQQIQQMHQMRQQIHQMSQQVSHQVSHQVSQQHHQQQQQQVQQQQQQQQHMQHMFYNPNVWMKPKYNDNNVNNINPYNMNNMNNLNNVNNMNNMNNLGNNLNNSFNHLNTLPNINNINGINNIPNNVIEASYGTSSGTTTTTPITSNTTTTTNTTSTSTSTTRSATMSSSGSRENSIVAGGTPQNTNFQHSNTSIQSPLAPLNINDNINDISVSHVSHMSHVQNVQSQQTYHSVFGQENDSTNINNINNISNNNSSPGIHVDGSGLVMDPLPLQTRNNSSKAVMVDEIDRIDRMDDMESIGPIDPLIEMTDNRGGHSMQTPGIGPKGSQSNNNNSRVHDGFETFDSTSDLLIRYPPRTQSFGTLNNLQSLEPFSDNFGNDLTPVVTNQIESQVIGDQFDQIVDQMNQIGHVKKVDQISSNVVPKDCDCEECRMGLEIKNDNVKNNINKHIGGSRNDIRDVNGVNNNNNNGFINGVNGVNGVHSANGVKGVEYVSNRLQNGIKPETDSIRLKNKNQDKNNNRLGGVSKEELTAYKSLLEKELSDMNIKGKIDLTSPEFMECLRKLVNAQSGQMKSPCAVSSPTNSAVPTNKVLSKDDSVNKSKSVARPRPNKMKSSTTNSSTQSHLKIKTKSNSSKKDNKDSTDSKDSKDSKDSIESNLYSINSLFESDEKRQEKTGITNNISTNKVNSSKDNSIDSKGGNKSKSSKEDSTKIDGGNNMSQSRESSLLDIGDIGNDDIVLESKYDVEKENEQKCIDIVCNYKVEKCDKGEKCPNGRCNKYHFISEQRRSPLLYKYSWLPCKRVFDQVNKLFFGTHKTCKDGYNCKYSHNFMESWYHPNIFHTQLCPIYNKLNKCGWGFYCSHFHEINDKRSSPVKIGNYDNNNDIESKPNTLKPNLGSNLVYNNTCRTHCNKCRTLATRARTQRVEKINKKKMSSYGNISSLTGQPSTNLITSRSNDYLINKSIRNRSNNYNLDNNNNGDYMLHQHHLNRSDNVFTQGIPPASNNYYSKRSNLNY